MTFLRPPSNPRGTRTNHTPELRLQSQTSADLEPVPAIVNICKKDLHASHRCDATASRCAILIRGESVAVSIYKIDAEYLVAYDLEAPHASATFTTVSAFELSSMSHVSQWQLHQQVKTRSRTSSRHLQLSRSRTDIAAREISLSVAG